MQNPSRCSLLRALAISLLLHGVLLTSPFAPLPVRLDLATVVLKAVIVARPVPAASASSATPNLASGVPASPAKPADLVRRPVARAERALVARPVRGATVADAAPTDAAPGAMSAPVQVAPTAGTPGPRTAVSGTEPTFSNDAVSADDLRHYRLSLAIAARRFKRYPAQASARGWEGTAEVAVTIRTAQPVPQVLLLRSSGRSLLDAQALEMLNQAAYSTPLPEGLRARDFRVVLPVEFSLEDDH